MNSYLAVKCSFATCPKRPTTFREVPVLLKGPGIVLAPEDAHGREGLVRSVSFVCDEHAEEIERWRAAQLAGRSS